MFEIPQKIRFIMEKLTLFGHKAYIVGGCVRDILMNKIPADYDIATSATPKEVISIFEKTVPTGLKHGTVTVLIDSEPIEVTTFRTETEYNDNRHPENVEFVSDITQDLSRRDFTINAMAYNPTAGIIDCYGGKADIENKLLRCVGNAEMRFTEDALRILRLFRFASTLNFEIEKNTLNAALKKAYLLQNISRERIFAELKKACKGNNFKIFSHLINCDGLKFIGITEIPDFEKIKKFRNCELLCLYIFLGGKNIENFHPSAREKKFFDDFQNLSTVLLPLNKTEIKKILRYYDPETVKTFLIYKNQSTSDLQEVLNSGEPYKISDLAIDGAELIKAGFSGKEIGKILDHLLEIVISQPNKNNKTDLLKEIP